MYTSMHPIKFGNSFDLAGGDQCGRLVTKFKLAVAE
jgi:hypothetical protein